VADAVVQTDAVEEHVGGFSVVTGIEDHSCFCVIAKVVARATARQVCDALLGGDLSMVEQRYDAVREVLDGATVKDVAIRYPRWRSAPASDERFSDRCG
jgi:hypothetical protein